MSSSELDDPGHGHSVAAWTAVLIMLISFAMGTVAFFFSVVWLVWLSAALVVAGLIVGKVLSRFGYGVDGEKTGQK